MAAVWLGVCPRHYLGTVTMSSTSQQSTPGHAIIAAVECNVYIALLLHVHLSTPTLLLRSLVD